MKSPLEFDSEQTREAIRVVGEGIARWYGSIRERRPAGTCVDVSTGGVRRDWTVPPALADAALPERGEALEPLVRFVTDVIGPDGGIVGHPGYMAYVAGTANLVSVLGQSLASAVNPYTGTYATAPAAVRLEDQVIRWFAGIVGLPPDAGGFLTSGSSLAILSAVIAARERAKAPWEKARIYVSGQTHHCVGKALFAAGFRAENLVVLPTRDFAMDADALVSRLAADRAAGLVPVLVVGTAGSTNTGRADPLHAIADAAAAHGAWFHCDAAYGGFFRLAGDVPALRGMERADSISLDPHKALQMPYGTGALLVRHVQDLRFPRELAATYMPPMDESDLRLEYSDIGPELTRDFRGLRVWLALRHFGLAPFRENLRAKLALAQRAAAAIDGMPALERAAPVDLAIVAFRVRGDASGDRTRALLRAVNEDGRFFLTACLLDGRPAIRICMLGFRCDDAVVDALLAKIRASA